VSPTYDAYCPSAYNTAEPFANGTRDISHLIVGIKIPSCWPPIHNHARITDANDSYPALITQAHKKSLSAGADFFSSSPFIHFINLAHRCRRRRAFALFANPSNPAEKKRIASHEIDKFLRRHRAGRITLAITKREREREERGE